MAVFMHSYFNPQHGRFVMWFQNQEIQRGQESLYCSKHLKRPVVKSQCLLYSHANTDVHIRDGLLTTLIKKYE